MYSRLILQDKPDIVWPFDNINESSSVSNPVSFYSTSASFYAASVNASATSVWDIPIVFGGGKVLKLSSSATPNISIPLLSRFSELYGRRESCIEFWMRADKVPSREVRIATKRNNPNIGLYLKENYLMFRYGTSSSYMEASYGLAELDEPTHIVLNHNQSGIELIVNGISTITNNENSIFLDIDLSHSTNDYFDFYGSSDYNLLIDCVAIYPFNVKSNTAKTHYVYGLGKDVNENIFISMGGDFYNLSTQNTRKSYYGFFEDPDDWSLIRYDNLIHSQDGIRPYNNDVPDLVLFDNNIRLTGNKISFTSSAGNTSSAAYFNIDNLPSIINSGENPFFVKVQFDGALPAGGLPQTIMSYGNSPTQPLIDFNFTNISGSYYLVVNNNVTNSSVSFIVPSVSSSPTAILGMSYDNETKFYFALSGSALQTASMTTYSGSSFGVDPSADIFPPTDTSVIRIGSALTYEEDYTLGTFNPGQFTGTFYSFIVARNSLTASTYSQIDNYSQPVYSLIYDSTNNRFRNRSYGNANFIIHGAQLAAVTESGSAVISGNRFEFGYPDVISGSQVSIYATLYNYSGSVVYPKTKLQKINSLQWINLINMNDKYLYFDIDILAEDSFSYPPFVKYLKVESYPYTGSYVEILDNSGDRVRIHSASTASAQAFVPEFQKTPSIFVTDSSGIRVYRNNVDVEFSPMSKSLDLNTLPNLLLWYDSRFPIGTNNVPYSDGSSLNRLWRSLSGSAITASVVSTTNNPEYRQQSLNLLTINQANGSESGSVTIFTANVASVQSSTDIASSGNRSIKVIPNGTSSDSYIDFGLYTNTSSANRFLFPGQQYSFIGDISLLKSQTSGGLNSLSRRLYIYFASVTSGGTGFGVLGAATSGTASNVPGTYTLSAVGTVPIGTNWISVRYYNGSSITGDPVYWDNMAIYAGSVVSGSPAVYYDALQVFDDRPIYKFNGLTHYFTSSVAINQPMTVYIAGRSFGSDNTFIGHSASAPAIYTESNTFRMAAGQVLVGPSVNSNFNVIAGVFNNNSSSLFVNSSVVSGNVGTGSYSSAARIGYRQTPSGANSYLNGDIAAVIVFNRAHSKTDVDLITDWMRDAFNIS